jgi:hypothetical protein
MSLMVPWIVMFSGECPGRYISVDGRLLVQALVSRMRMSRETNNNAKCLFFCLIGT